MDPQEARAKMEQAAALLVAVVEPEYVHSVQLGCGNQAALDMLAALGAPLHTSFYWEDGTAIDSREITIGRVSFRAQTNHRPITDEERRSKDRRDALDAQIKRLMEERDGLAVTP